MSDDDEYYENLSRRNDDDIPEPEGEMLDRDGKKPVRKKPFQFRSHHDLELLREVVTTKPFGKLASQRWKEIFQRLNFPVKDGAALQRRFKDTLLKKFKSDNRESLKGSGLEEEYDEKIQLLEEIVELIENQELADKDVSEAVRKKVDAEAAKAKTIRDAAMETFRKAKSLDTDISPPPPKKTQREAILGYLQQSNQLEVSFKEMETRRLDLQEKDLELKREELEIRKENEAHRREMERRKLELEENKCKIEGQEKSLLLELLSQQLKK